MATEQLYWRKIICGCFRFKLLLLWKGAQNDAIVLYLPKQNTFQITKSIYVLTINGKTKLLYVNFLFDPNPIY